MSKIKMIFFRVLIIGIIGTIAGLCLYFLIAIGRVRFRHFERFPLFGEKLIIVVNHPSTKETYLIPLVFFPWWFRKFLKPHPIPISTPDRNNFPYLILLKEYVVFIDRSKKGVYKRMRAIFQMIKNLEEGANIILFIEGTRTGNALEKIISPKGKEMGVPQSSLGFLVEKTGAGIFPLWVETSWSCPNKIPFFLQVLIEMLSLPFVTTEIICGETIKFGIKEPDEEITRKTIEAMFALADEG